MLTQTISSVIAELRQDPANADLETAFWDNLGFELSDSRRWYVMGQTLQDPPREMVMTDAKDCIQAFRNRAVLIKRRNELIEEIRLNNPARMATDLGPAPDAEYEAYLKRYDRSKQDLAAANKDLGLPEHSQVPLEK